ncbi:type IV pilus modification protein PilV [Microbulbifer bruguierae]|uniref:Type IV pilus modification protein PilV n=1 Tax=Microbulbifer bruguierae TaxID=3029061 RepID=A0ABY8NIK3_9GAMM|nr:type IV pilus modification protein PilV [Microbulbifer bruguierae]WGL18189.1 type IV pilus modification protein PilV [Microbulbifer bruguierae]
MKKQQGAGLIEVLVTVLIMGTSLLALAALQSKSLHYNHGAYLRSQANILAYDLLDRIRLNQEKLDSYLLEPADPADADADAPEEEAEPAESTLASQDLEEWQSELQSALPGANGQVSCEAVHRVCTVTIEWSEQNSSGDTSEDTTKFVYTTRI